VEGHSICVSFGLGWLVLVGLALSGQASPVEPRVQPSRKMDDRKVKRATEVKDRHIDAIMALPAVVGAGIGASTRQPDEVAILLYLSRALKPRERRRFPQVLEGIPVETVVTGPFTERQKKAARPHAGNAGGDQNQK
jgi:hypothetical protein